MRELARERGGVCLSDHYVNFKTHLQWQCAQGHQWSTAPTTVRNGSWCRECGYANRRLTMDHMHQFAKEHDGLCLSDHYIDWKTPLMWQCDQGHQWSARPTYIQKGNWCPECAHEKGRLTITEMQQIANERGGRCLSKKYINNNTHLKWECENHHRWQAVPASVKQGGWCPVCAIAARKRHTIADMQALAQQHGGDCLSKRFVNIGSLLKWRCAKGHIWKAPGNGVKSGVWCRRCFSDRMKDTLEDMHAMAHAKGGKCLATAYVNSTTHLEWECAAGHRWMAMPATIKKAWCPACKFDDKRLGIEKMREMASMHGGRCLSETYKNCHTKLTWQCIEGHIWETKPMVIQNGHWCPECSRNRATVQRLLDKKKKKSPFAIPRLI
jgi:hypothetical protein